ncbi:hypothetical protein FACS1894104_4300 [Actinomycetota bacterium]|nr:hypothetical protein FACS1894104_4300 [Actinomycetota bacterium]
MIQLVGESVVLKQRGREFWGCCPFHDEKTPSFKVDSSSQLYHCFGCGAGGDAYKFVMQTQNLEFIDAVRYLAGRSNIQIKEDSSGLSQGKRARLLDICQKTAEFYHQQLMRVKGTNTDVAREYLSTRDMGGNVAKDWQLGYAPGRSELVRHLQKLGFKADEMVEANVAAKGQGGGGQLRDRFYERVMFPIYDLQGRAVAFGGRIIDKGEPKYINSSDTPLFHKRETLYAIDKAKSKITSTGTAIVVEGYTDTIAMHGAGFTNTVATLGTALTPQHLKLLNRFAKKVIYLFDGDEAGQRAAGRASELITKDITPEAGKFRAELTVAVLPAANDPADFLASAGVEAMQRTIDGAVPLLKFAIGRSLAGKQLDTPEQRSAALSSALQVLLPIRGSILANDYLGELAQMLGADFDSVKAAFDGLQTPRQYATPRTTGDPTNTQTSSADTAIPYKIATLQTDLLLLFIEEPEVRNLLSKAFEKIKWQGRLFQELAAALLQADKSLTKEQLYSVAIASSQGVDKLISGGLNLEYKGEVVNHARLLMYLLKEQQLQNQISQAKIAYKQQATNQLFKEISDLQLELAQTQEKLASIPKTDSL